MEVMDAILGRRSIRKYSPQAVDQELIRELLTAAMSAPSAGNEQPWHFVVIKDKNLLNEIPKFHPHSSMLREAPLAILVCGDLTLEKYKGYWVQDCSAATQNLLLAAHARGLGAVWLGIYPIDERVEGMRKLLSLPEHIVPLSVVSLGYPAERKSPLNRFQESRVHDNRW
jgi:nitroreductase